MSKQGFKIEVWNRNAVHAIYTWWCCTFCCIEIFLLYYISVKRGGLIFFMIYDASCSLITSLLRNISAWQGFGALLHPYKCFQFYISPALLQMVLHGILKDFFQRTHIHTNVSVNFICLKFTYFSAAHMKYRTITVSFLKSNGSLLTKNDSS